MSVLIWIQTVCNGYQQVMEKVIMKELFMSGDMGGCNVKLYSILKIPKPSILMKFDLEKET